MTTFILNRPIVYLNIPICVVSFFVLFFALRGVDLNPPAAASWRSLGQRFDFIGLYVLLEVLIMSRAHANLIRFLFMSATSCIIVGFSFATDVGCKYLSFCITDQIV